MADQHPLNAKVLHLLDRHLASEGAATLRGKYKEEIRNELFLFSLNPPKIG